MSSATLQARRLPLRLKGGRAFVSRTPLASRRLRAHAARLPFTASPKLAAGEETIRSRFQGESRLPSADLRSYDFRP
jgi:hypothetical protein